MTQVKDLNTLLGLINDGRSIAEINDLWPTLVKDLLDLSSDDSKKTFKGTITLKLTVEVQAGIAQVSLESAIKAPSRKPEVSIFFPTRDGYLSDEHPKQIAMFGGGRPRVVDQRGGGGSLVEVDPDDARGSTVVDHEGRNAGPA